MKILNFSLIFSVLVLLVNCVSHKGRIDDKHFWKDKDLESAYKEALIDRKKSCSVFISLSRHNEFLLKEEALYHALQNCSKEELSQLNLNISGKTKVEDFFTSETLKNYTLYLRLIKQDSSYLSSGTDKLITGSVESSETISRTDEPVAEESEVAKSSATITPSQAPLLTSTPPSEVLTLEQIDRLSQLFNEKSRKLDFYKKFISFCGEDEYCASQIKNKIYSLNPIEDPELPVQNPILYADQLRDTRAYTKALQIYKHELQKEKNPEIKSRIYKKIILTHKLQGRKDLLLKSADEFYKQSKVGYLKNKSSSVYRSLYVEAATLVARRFWTENEVDKGERILNEANGFLTQDQEEVLFILAKIAESKGFQAQALYSYSTLLNQINRQSPELLINVKDQSTPLQEQILQSIKKYKTLSAQHSKYFWSLSWFFIKNKDWQAANSILNILTQSTSESSDQYKYMFWLAFTYEKLDQPNEAKPHYQTLYDRDLIGYYGVVAGYRLNKALAPLPAVNKKVYESSWPLEIKKLALMAYVGDNTLFPVYLNDLRSKFNQAEYTYYFHVFNAFNGSYLPLFAYIAQTPYEEKKSILQSNSALIYPLDFVEIIEKEASEQNFSKEFALSIIRQESAFHPRARSGSDALGLMQLIPGTARKNLQRLNLKIKFQPEDLYQPDLNVKLGISELKNLYDKSNGSFIYAAAAYNAGEIPIKKWLKERPTDDSLIFIEDIPYEETRTYVKLALRNYTFYKRLLSGSDFTVPDELFVIPK